MQLCKRMQNSEFSEFHNRLSKTQQPVETYLGPQYSEQISQDREIQNGNTRDTKDLPPDWGVGNVHRFQEFLLPHFNSNSGSTYIFMCKGIPTSLKHCHLVCPQHPWRSRVQTDGITKGYKNLPVPKRLVSQSQIQPNLSPVYTNSSSSVSRIRLDSKF